MRQIEALIDKLKAARAPSRELDREILRIVSGKDGTREIETAYPFRWSCWFAPRYTASVDAALSLCEPRISWKIWSTMEGAYAADAFLKLKDMSERPTGLGQTAPIALCIAALKARDVAAQHL
jgi:hypothetical protein